MDYNVNHFEGGNELGDMFKRHNLPKPALAMQTQSALT
jgi:hypothetical protein